MASWLGRARQGTVETIGRALGSPAVWFFAVCYAAATLYAFSTQGAGALASSLPQLGFLVLIVLTIFVTAPVPMEDPLAAHDSGGLVWYQFAVTLVFILLTGYTALGFHGVIPASAAHIPVWTPFLEGVAAFAERTLPAQFFTSPGNSLVNPMQYFVIPLLLLLILGAHLSELGFGRGHRSWLVILLWCGVEFAVWAMQMVSGVLNPMRLVTTLISNFFQNGFFEEFLFRGALQTRLRLLVDPAWALVLASLIFGLWHLGADVRASGGDLAGGVALAIRTQAVLGLVFGVIFMRTRNLFACTVTHTVLNSFFG
jgi:membrane protease YdiL (CAAX protease family)